jgi:hypothetical protein
MARKGGNPDLEKYQFTTDRDESLTAKFTLRVTPKMLTELQAVEGNWREFVRDAIADKLQQENFEARQNGK